MQFNWDVEFKKGTAPIRDSGVNGLLKQYAALF